MGPKRTFFIQCVICLCLLIFCIILRFTPDNTYAKAKACVRAILTVHTDTNAIKQMLSDRIQNHASSDQLAPVTDMTAPTEGVILKGFGMQDASESSFHYGIVLSCPDGKPIVAANDGTVEEIATNQEYGSFVLVKHSEEISTLYGKLDEIFPDIGEKVEAGQLLATAEDKNSFYFELRRGDTFLDPAEYITFREASHD